MDKTIFSQSVVRVRYMENSLIPKEKLESMADEPNHEQCVKILQDTIYGRYIGSGSFDEGLKVALQDIYSLLKEIVPVKQVVQIPALRYDLHNIKCLIKGRFSCVDTGRLLIDAGVFSPVDLKNAVQDQDYSNIHPDIKKTIDSAIKQFMETNSPQDIDVIADRFLYKYMAEEARKSKVEFLEEFIKLLIDVKNIKIFLRTSGKTENKDLFRKLFLEGGKLGSEFFYEYENEPIEKFTSKLSFTGFYRWSQEIADKSIESIEKFGDNFIMKYMKKAKFIAFGPEPIIAYILARETEIKNIRIVLTGKLNGVSSDAIRERLRDTYV